MGLNTDRTIIVGEDNGLDSPNTLVLKHEEAVRGADGGGPRRGSLTILDMATYGKAQLPSVPGRFPIFFSPTYPVVKMRPGNHGCGKKCTATEARILWRLSLDATIVAINLLIWDVF